MKALKQEWQDRVLNALRALAEEMGIEGSSISADQLIASTPPNPELGDIAFPLFPFAKVFHKAPADIVQRVINYLVAHDAALEGDISKQTDGGDTAAKDR